MVRLRKIRTDSPMTTMGILAFSVDSGAPKVEPHHVLAFAAVIAVVELLLNFFL
jgi:preprotein translocase subunit Sec61beta